MNEKILSMKNSVLGFWQKSSNKTKILIIGSFLLLVLIGSAFTLLAKQTNLVPLYGNLTPSETGEIKAQLDSKGIQSQITNGGTTILVPAENVENLTVELAAQGIPQSKDVDYSFFSENAGFGMTDNEFDMLKVDAMQTELANLIKGINGVKNAKVMLSIPEKSMWMNSETEEASASIVIEQEYGTKISQEQITGLYNLISRSVPNLSTENIVIMNQMFETFSFSDGKNSDFTKLGDHLSVKKEIEKDLQQQVQSLLGTVMGPNKVKVMVTADIDFTQETREENIVAPVDIEKNEGLSLSVERITETFTGNKPDAVGVDATAGTGQGDIPNYAETGNQNGDYKRTEERVNNEVNKIHKNIVQAPYSIRDLGLQVVVEPPDPKDVESLTPETKEDIENLLGTIVRTTIQQSEPLSDEQIQEKIFVSVQPFNGKVEFDTNGNSKEPFIPIWVYILGGILLLVIVILIVLMNKKRKKQQEEAELEEAMALEKLKRQQHQRVEDIEFSEDPLINQLSKMSKTKPEQVVKLLRTWMSEER